MSRFGDSTRSPGALGGHTWGGGAEWLVPPPTPSEHRTPARVGPRATFGAASIQNVGKDNENQDAFVTSANSEGSKCFVGVFDGHGERGKRMSEFSKNTLTKNFFSQKDIHVNPKAAFENAYQETQSQIEKTHGHEAACSGTTAVAAYQHHDKLFVANVGDSRAVLGRCESSRSGGQSAELRAIELSSDHKPSRADEKRRITEQGGVVQQGTFPMMGPMGTLRFVRAGPERVMDKTGFNGLAMSRSLGDLSLRPYVSAEPEVSEFQLNQKDKTLILGTDGVWDHVSSQEAVNIASRHRDPTLAAREITNIARKRWHAVTQGMMTDDITAVVVNLEHGGGGSTPTARTTTAPARRRLDRASLQLTSTGRPEKPGSMSSPSTPAMLKSPARHAKHDFSDRANRIKPDAAVRLEPLRRQKGRDGLPSHLLPPAGR